jgi:hypothetical protein
MRWVGREIEENRAMKTRIRAADERERALTRRVVVGLILVAAVVVGLLAYDWFLP